MFLQTQQVLHPQQVRRPLGQGNRHNSKEVLEQIEDVGLTASRQLDNNVQVSQMWLPLELILCSRRHSDVMIIQLLTINILCCIPAFIRTNVRFLIYSVQQLSSSSIST